MHHYFSDDDDDNGGNSSSSDEQHDENHGLSDDSNDDVYDYPNRKKSLFDSFNNKKCPGRNNKIAQPASKNNSTIKKGSSCHTDTSRKQGVAGGTLDTLGIRKRVLESETVMSNSVCNSRLVKKSRTMKRSEQLQQKANSGKMICR